MNYFSVDELKCKCCGVNRFNARTLNRLNHLRMAIDKPITLSSAYRCKAYNIKIGATQTHATGQAVDILTSHKDAMEIIETALMVDFTGLGVKQKGSSRFIHLDDLKEDLDGQSRPRPHIWSY